ncbi:hypothetical protein BRADI_2g11212v3 [Brachypodium distachyon]|uniref:Uncharacterized protein n=1 Tax=Brachypodium distachyon TaxID=15368 RepID=A0A2K2D7Z4_BRADI|nr:hypothetical protein BRADI_2g11212v3 [Brachypodium distachyon]PNT70384.1 hypothetical protein BRADI_2g11212v3 [Brachypodium distachyon]
MRLRQFRPHHGINAARSSSPLHRFLLWDDGLFLGSLSPTSSGSDRRLPDCHADNNFLALTWFESPKAALNFAQGALPASTCRGRQRRLRTRTCVKFFFTLKIVL